MMRLLAGFAVVLLLAIPAIAATTTVTPANLSGWVEQNSTCGAPNTGTTSFVTGPATPPLGVGSAQMNVGANGDSFNGFRTLPYNGVLLSSLSQLSYSTYTQVDGSGGQSPYLLFNVDYNGDAVTDDQLFFEPIYQGPTFFPSNPQGPLAAGVWQTWDALNGGWWSVNTTGGAGPGINVKPLSAIIAAQPNARLAPAATGSFRVMTGCGAGAWDNFIGNFDNVNVQVANNPVDTWDFEPAPSITIADLSQNEGSGGTTNFNFVLTLSSAVSQTVTVTYTAADNTATATAADADYVPVSATATFAPNTTTATATVVVNADNKFEPNETFFVDLTAPANATISDPQATGTIVNDDGQPSISIADQSCAEGNAGTTNCAFTVTLSNPSSLPISVNWATAPGTATAGSDYTTSNGVANFAPGQVINNTAVAVPVIGDTSFEPAETFFVDLSGATNATIADDRGIGTITADDGASADVSITKTGPAAVRPGNPINYTITVSNAGPQTASNVVVTDVIPAGATFGSATPSQGSCSGTTTVTCNLGAILSGGSATITLVLTAPNTSTAVVNTASVTNTPEADPNPANNVAIAAPAIVLSEIPTLSEWALLALVGMLAIFAARKV